jgi:hypothetical protein
VVDEPQRKRVRFNEDVERWERIKERKQWEMTTVVSVAKAKEESLGTKEEVKEDTTTQSRQDGATVTAKAVKADDASVPEHLWDTRIFSLASLERLESTSMDLKSQALKVFREKWLFRFWYKKVERDFVDWYRNTQHKAGSETAIWNAGMQACVHARRASWWDWEGGSSIFFWRWPKNYQEEARSGVPPCFIGKPPTSMNAQPPYKDESTRQKVRAKLKKILMKGYISMAKSEDVESLMYMFDVPKGENDLRMVYDGSKSGLNEALWAPWFLLDTVDAMMRGLRPNYWCADNDYGEQFLNFNLHEDLQKYCGVDLAQLFPELRKEGAREGVLGMWRRNAMGLKPSPYNSVKGALRAKKIMLGNRKVKSNPFHWERVELNMPGDEGYDATKPWIMKLREDGSSATELRTYIDDLRTTAKDRGTAWLASSQIAKTCSWLGLQDAARKRREPSQTPGAWAGATVSTDEARAYKSVTKERWVKTQKKIRWLAAQAGEFDARSSELLDMNGIGEERMGTPDGHMDFKTAESNRGFLVYVSRTFKSMVPYLKGLHLSLDSWREGRDREGWKDASWVQTSGAERDEMPRAPKFVRWVPRFPGDIRALMELTFSVDPPQIPSTPSEAKAVYMVGDASGSGFGVSVWQQDADDMSARFGAWEQGTTEKSSNFREAYNLVLRIERMVETGEFREGTELFVFTDNAVSERAFYKGSSSSRLLHELVLKLRKLEMKGDLFVHFIWIAGKRMIQQGTDGLSRGDLTSGVMAGDDFLKHVPLNLSAMEREEGLAESLLASLPGQGWKILEPGEWFDEAFANDQGRFVWVPPPALANVALEQLCEVFHVHPKTSHVFVCPALMTGAWRKTLGKVSDVMVTVPLGSDVWGEQQHEPLVLSLTCPLLACSPWKVKRDNWVEEWESQLSCLWRERASARRSHLRKFWVRAWARA